MEVGSIPAINLKPLYTLFRNKYIHLEMDIFFMDKYTEAYLRLITEAGDGNGGKGPLVVMDDTTDNNNIEDDRYILKVGDKFASSPLTKLTNNFNFAGVIHGKAEADSIMKYYKDKGMEDVELIPWADRDKLA